MRSQRKLKKMLASLALAAIQLTQTAFPVGSYRTDLSKAPETSRGILGTYFGRAYLVLQTNGEFKLCGVGQEGYWRKSGNRYVLVYDGLFALRFPEPESALRKKWPKSHLEGHVLTPGPGGTLVLSDFGRVAGPVVFRPMPRRSIADLVVRSGALDDSPESQEAHTLLNERIEIEWPAALAFIQNHYWPLRQRSWAAIVLGGLKDPGGILAAAKLIADLKPSFGDKRFERIRSSLARAAAQHPTPEAADLLIEAVQSGLIDPKVAAPALAKLKRKSDVPYLIGWLESMEPFDRLESLNALAQMDSKDGPPHARRLTSDPDEMVQIAAHGLLARLSDDASERRSAIRKLATWIKSSEFLLPFEAVSALENSKHPDALPHLLAILVSDLDPILRRNTALAIGRIGDPRAVPVLIEAKLRTDGPGSLVQESDVRRAAAEALVKISGRGATRALRR